MRTRTALLALGLVAVTVLAGCPSKPKPDPTGKEAARDGGPNALSSGSPSNDKPADAVHGKELVLGFQCNRCHEGTGHPAAAQNKHCVQCHKDIIEDRFQAPPASIARWKPRVKDLADAPSLEATGKRLTRQWVERYLLQPNDLRPHLAQFMPRLAITREEARDVAAYLVADTDKPASGSENDKPEGDLGKGRQLLDTKGCGSCHAFSGIAAIATSAPPAMDGKDFERGRKLAPDLRFTRDRMTKAKLTAWLQDPKGVKPDTAMPKIALSDAETKDLAAYILSVETKDPPPKPKLARLPVLTRKVTFKEVDEKVFHRTCWHCHSEPDYAIGDGGPGNSGGFGFKPRGLNLSDYNGIAAGYVDDKGERASIFIKDKEEVPRIVRALLARHDEENGAETGAVRGMPLGYEPLPAEDIQLVESWVAQGRPR
jgi:mono/diheme cytochrome c family protein